MNHFLFLVHAHDHVWRDRRIPLDDRLAACEILWKAAAIQRNMSRAAEAAAEAMAILEAREAERLKWKMRLDLLIADFRDRGKLLRGTTTWEQAYQQAAIKLEEAVEELAAPPDHDRRRNPG